MNGGRPGDPFPASSFSAFRTSGTHLKSPSPSPVHTPPLLLLSLSSPMFDSLLTPLRFRSLEASQTGTTLVLFGLWFQSKKRVVLIKGFPNQVAWAPSWSRTWLEPPKPQAIQLYFPLVDISFSFHMIINLACMAAKEPWILTFQLIIYLCIDKPIARKWMINPCFMCRV